LVPNKVHDLGNLFAVLGIDMLNRGKYAVFVNCGDSDGEEVLVGRNGWKRQNGR
jgi:hypothetical protein